MHEFWRPLVRRPIHMLTGSLFLIVLTTQGCLAGAWLAAVGFDTSRTSDLAFAPFEHSWVARSPAVGVESAPAAVNSVAVAPFEGDATMAERFATVIGTQTTLRVVGPAEVNADVGAPVNRSADRAIATELQGHVAKTISKGYDVESVLFGRVQEIEAHPAEWGLKEKESKRLFLYLVDRHGTMLWKDELPFTVVKGSKPLSEDMIHMTLAARFMTHAEEVGLTGLGFTPRRPS